MALKDDIERIAAQERDIVLPAFDENIAFQLGTTLREDAIQNGWGVTIDIQSFARPLFFAATPGSTPENNDWMRRKSNVVRLFHKSSYRVGLELRLKDTTLEARNGLPTRDYAPHGGSFPIRVKDAGVVGILTISGLPQRQDHEVVAAALCSLAGLSYTDYALGPEE